MSDSTKKWLLKEILPLVAVVGGSAGGAILWITGALADLRSEIADVRTDLSAEISDVRERVASVEGKLDLLVSNLDIQVTVATTPDQPDSPPE